MITVLVVSAPGRARDLDEAAARMPSLELLHAIDVEQALDRLARNRRIDAVLLLVENESASEIVRVVLEEDPGAPPLYAQATGGEIAGVRALPASTAEELLGSIVSSLSS
jgi:hypothetical protein